MTDFYTLVDDFHLKFKFPRAYSEATRKVLKLRSKLVAEEAREFVEAMENEDIGQAIKEACDLLYVTFGFFVTLGIRPDKYFREVHASNMSKVDENGRPRYREDGKLSKEGTRYWKADMKYLLPPDIRHYVWGPDREEPEEN